MSRYGYKDKSFARATVSAIIFFLVLQAILVVLTVVVARRDSHELDISSNLSTVTYSEENGTSTFNVDLTVSNGNRLVVTATNVSYKLIFKDESGAALYEVTVNSPEDITKKEQQFTYAFGSGEYEAVSGKVSSVETELASADFVNNVVYKGGPIGFDFIVENWWLALGVLATLFLLLFANYFEIENAVGSTILSIICNAAAVGLAIFCVPSITLAILASLG